MRTHIGIAAILALAALASCATTPAEKPVLTRSAVQSIARDCRAIKGEFHPDGKALPYVVFVIRGEDVRDNMGDMCFARRLSAYRYAMMSYREEGPSPVE